MNDTWWVDPDEMNDEQKDVIGLGLGEHHLVSGPPGSGKTNLLLLRANHIILAGDANVLVLVLTRSLREFLVAGGSHYSVPPDRIITSMRWRFDLLRQYGVPCEQPAGGYTEQREYLHQKLTELVEERSLSAIYDAVLLDEAQDYLPEEIELLARLSKVIFAVADSRQKIYEGADSLALLKRMVKRPVALKFHYRNGHEICRLADGIAKDSDRYEPMITHANYNAKKYGVSTVDVVKCSDLDAQADVLLDRLSSQLKAYPGQLIGVMAPRRDQVNVLARRLRESQFADLFVVHQSGEHGAFEDDKPICLATFHAGKGLEFRAVHLVGCDGLKGPLSRNMTFMAVTRAKTSLTIYHSASLHGFLDGALAKLKPVPKVPTTKEVFRGRP